MNSPDVLVIGAGFAGLSAAVRLTERGRRVLVCEARPVLGGRATTHTDPASGERVDNGQHVLFGCYRETIAFLDTIGATGQVSFQERLETTIIDREGRRSTLRCPGLPPPWHVAIGVLRWSALPWSERTRVLRMAKPIRQAQRILRRGGRACAPPGETLDRWLERHGQGPRLRELLWDPLALAALNQAPSDAEASPFARVLAEMFGGSRQSAAIGLPAAPLTDVYAEPARRFIESRGGVVRTNAQARIIVKTGQVRGAMIGDERIDARAIVSAAPWHALPTIFVDEPLAMRPIVAAAEKTAASPIVTVNMWFDRPVLDAPFLGLPGRTFQWAFDRRRIVGDGCSHISLVSSGAADIAAQPNETTSALAHRELTEALPEAGRAVMRRATVVRERRATFSLAPGQPARPGAATPINGLYLAGDWTDTGLPATIEGAVVSGHRAADLATS